MSNKAVQVSLKISLKDYQAFEDLASDLGYVLDVEKLVDLDTGQTFSSVPTKQKGKALSGPRRKTKVYMTAAAVQAIKVFKGKHPHCRRADIVEHIQQSMNLNYSMTVVGDVLTGKYDEYLAYLKERGEDFSKGPSLPRKLPEGVPPIKPPVKPASKAETKKGGTG